MKKIELLVAALFVACATHSQIVINEFCVSSNSFLDEYGDDNDWLELYNPSDSDVDLTGWHLSDKATKLTKWTFPAVTLKAGAYMQIFASGKDLTDIADGKFLHTNFNMSSDGEVIYLVNADGKIVHQTDSVAVRNDASCGLSPDGTGEWVFFVEPTPGAANSTRAYPTQETASVQISPKGGVCKSAVTITLSSANNTPIYYTLDCTVPTEKSMKYTGPITVDTTTVIRAITFNDDLMPGQPATQTYIFGKKLKWVNRDTQGKPVTQENTWGGWGGWGGGQNTKVNPNKSIAHEATFDLPVVALTTDPYNLWDYNYGIYVEGPNAQQENPHRGANYHEDWERPVHVELYWTDGEQRIDQDAGIKIAGAYSRMNEQKSFAIHARNSYGKKYFDCKLFDEIELGRFKSFVLRDSGNDFGSTHFRDAMVTHLVYGRNIDIQAYQPAVVFLNGEYWGILNIREKVNEHYIENHYPSVSADNVDLVVASDVTKNMAASEGDIDDYDAMISYIKSNDLTNDDCYKYITKLIDIDEYIEYMVSEIYASNNDWPHNNVKIWKSKNADGRWRWFLYDTDQTYSIWSEQTNDDKLGTCLNEKDTHGNTWANVLFRNLTKNEKFRNALANRFADRMNCEFLPKNVKHLIDSLGDNISKEISYHNSRWNKSYNSGAIDRMNKFADGRPSVVRNNLRTHFSVGADVKITLSVNDPEAGYVQINSLTIKSFPWSGSYFKNVPVSVRAVARPGYRFSHWENAEGENVEEHSGVLVNLTAASTYKAVFETDDSDFNSVVINEINYKSADEHDTKDWVELYNTTSSAIDLSGWTLSDEEESSFCIIPVGTMIPPYGYLVLSSKVSKLTAYHSDIQNVAGDFSFGLGKADVILLKDSEGNLVDVVNYNVKSKWPDANGNGYTMALTDPFADNSSASAWQTDVKYGTPGAENGNFSTSHTDFTVNDYSFNDLYNLRIFTVDDEEQEALGVYAMCYPNPFNSNAKIMWEQTSEANVRIELFSASGQKLSEICNGWFAQGQHEVSVSEYSDYWNAGLYFAKISIGNNPPVVLKLIKRQ